MLLSQYLTNANLLPQFIVSKIVKGADGVVKKFPCNPWGEVANHKDPANWMNYEAAYERVKELGPDFRVGFSISKDSGVFLIDVDKAFSDGKWSDLANTLCSKFNGCFVETSQSGKGVHIMGRSTKRFEHKNKNTALNLELYTSDRFVMFGGYHPRGDWNFDATEALSAFIETYMSTEVNQEEDEILPVEELTQWTDEEVIEKCKKRREPSHIFGGKASFKDLWEGDISGYPSASEADLALANKIAVFTINEPQIERIMRKSGLMREKWDTNKTYLPNTISQAVKGRKAMHSQQTQFNDSSSNCQDLLGTIPQEFKNCYYILSAGKIYSPSIGFMTKADFNVVYGGRYYPTSPMDPKATNSAYKSFEGHAALAGHVIDDTCFRPDLPCGQIQNYQDQRKINTYRKPTIKRLKGDASLFYQLLDALYPDKRDQRILLSYMARCVQSPGVKANWCPVLQGGEGIGKSTILQYVAYAVGRHYTHSIVPDEFDTNFNWPWYGKVLLFVEDPNLKNSRLEDLLKTLITQTEYSFEKKGEDRRMGDFLTNIFITTNDKHLIRKTENTRRYAMFISPLQTAEETFASGLTNEFFEKLGKWNKNGDGFEMVAEILHTYEVDPEFDFLGVCTRAPDTSTTVQAIKESKSEIELIIQEEVELGRSGFKGGWISSSALTDFLVGRRLSHMMPNNRKSSILRDMGYVPHPNLVNGRAHRNVSPDNKRPTLFILKDNKSIQLRDATLIVKAYEDAQKED